MRILHTVEFYHPSKGGAQEVVRQISELLVERGHQVTVATSKLPQRRETTVRGVQVREFACAGNTVRGLEGEIDAYRDFVISGNFDVVMNYAAQQWATDALLPCLAQIPGRKVLAPCGFSGLYDPAYAEYFRKLPEALAGYDHLVFHSDCYRDIEFCRARGLKHFSVIPNGARAAEFAHHDPGFRRRYGVPEDALMLLTLGSHTNWKGHEECLRAFGQARLGHAVLVVIGNTFGTPGCLRRDRALAAGVWLRSLGRKKVRLLDPPRTDVIAAYHEADLFVFPSNIECSPLVLFECLASRTPFLANDVGNSREIVAWSGGGAILPTYPKPQAPPGYCTCDVAQLTAAIEDLAAHPDRRDRFGAQGHKAWHDHFTWEALVARYEAVYQGQAVPPPPPRIAPDDPLPAPRPAGVPAIDFGAARGRHLEVDKWALSRWMPGLVAIVDAHPYPLDELMLMAAAFWHVRPQIVIDIGTHHGKSARVWYELARQSGLPCRVHTVDLCDPRHVEYPGQELGRFIRGLDVQQHVGDGYEVARRLLEAAPGQRALLFIDGDHAYETVRRELALLDLLRPGAALLHDTFYQPGSTYNHGPWLAIQDYLKDQPAFQVVALQTGLPGMTYIAPTDPHA